VLDIKIARYRIKFFVLKTNDCYGDLKTVFVIIVNIVILTQKQEKLIVINDMDNA